MGLDGEISGSADGGPLEPEELVSSDVRGSNGGASILSLRLVGLLGVPVVRLGSGVWW